MSLFPGEQGPMFVEAGYGINDGRVASYWLVWVRAFIFVRETCIIEYIPEINSSPSQFAFPSHSRSKIQFLATLPIV